MRPVEGEWEWCSIFGREAGDRDRGFFERALFSLNGLGTGKGKYLNSVCGRRGRGEGEGGGDFLPVLSFARMTDMAAGARKGTGRASKARKDLSTYSGRSLPLLEQAMKKCIAAAKMQAEREATAHAGPEGTIRRRSYGDP
ncbi:hypothetical protein K456DRAFT_62181 [Colletotrichum gloeosporioides 23]|nr:hypothetical protein K456DRAFT_62181 [Colletotrichum gloeosporioides 23]